MMSWTNQKKKRKLGGHKPSSAFVCAHSRAVCSSPKNVGFHLPPSFIHTFFRRGATCDSGSRGKTNLKLSKTLEMG